MRRLLAPPAALAIFLAAVAWAGVAQAGAPNRFAALVQEFYAGEFQASPTEATATGVHDYDARLDDVSAAAHARNVTRLLSVQLRLRGLNVVQLLPMERDDRDVLAAEVGRELLEEQAIQHWKHDPAIYVDLLTGGIFSLIERDFAPLPQRMANTIARENAASAMLAEAKKNLVDMPGVFVDIALENLDGAVGFLKDDVPAAFASVNDPALKGQFASSTKAVLAAVADFKTFLLAAKPKATASFVLGPDILQRLLGSDLVNVPFARVLSVGKAQLEKDRAAFLATEKLVDPAKPDNALSVVEKDHPDAAHLIQTASSQLEMLQKFIDSHKILDLPSAMLPTVIDTPPFARAMIFGALDPPGPLETHATKAYYYITPPDPKEPAAEQQTYLEYFNRPLLQNLSVHEALPGHYTQYLFLHANPDWSMVRKTAGSYTATEGWAHYVEQMMLDEGLSAGDPKARLAQLQDALLRDCRLVASISMHTAKMTLDEATQMMKQSCFQPDSVAYKEARRGTADPGYYSYTLGKLEILKLREDVQKQEGKDFSLARFHDSFLNAGLVPISVIRREILGHDGPVL